MRLLHVSTFELEDFVDEKCPRYVILSHTWGKEEITYQEILLEETVQQLKSAKSCLLEQVINSDQQYKQGCLKIAGCALRAHEEGADYIWCDTCCIDKTNSTELSEAINSMYTWYEDQGCYVYLADVPSEDDLNPDQRKRAFYSSRWFTRGWTLQELVAPAHVVFYDATWRWIGTRAEHRDLIAKRTGIDEEVLLGRNPLGYSVATRMSWASKRRTTRVEDLAYCLMGLFGVNMPLIYGEKHKAFLRLQTEIMKVSEDHSLFAWKTPEEAQESTTCGLLANSPADFADSSNVIPILPDDEGREGNTTQNPFTMTNRGVNISLQLLHVDSSQYDVSKLSRLFFATLESQDAADTRGPLGVFLVPYGGRSFRRCLSHRLNPAIDVAGRVGKNYHQVVYVAQQEDIRRRKAQWRFSFHIAELSAELLKEGAIMRVIPNFENLSVHWASEERRLELSSGLGAAIYIGRVVGYGKIFLIGIDSEIRIRCVLQQEMGVSDVEYHAIDVALYGSREKLYWSVWNKSFLDGEDWTYRDVSLDLGQWDALRKNNRFYSPEYKWEYNKKWLPRKLEVSMAINRRSLDGHWIYEAHFRKGENLPTLIKLDRFEPSETESD
ncbi:MAG: hypothetical protein LQ337_004739 [Flavoplaca oasis]|nr:MAG: hypothetical protein LQ337_004739 [Flavoplaca oasis]